MKAYQQEIFGPVLCVLSVDTLDEVRMIGITLMYTLVFQAIELVNSNRYGKGEMCVCIKLFAFDIMKSYTLEGHHPISLNHSFITPL